MHIREKPPNKTEIIPIIKVYVNNHRIEALLDTGSVKNVIRKDILKTFDYTDVQRNLLTAGGFKVPVLGSAICKVKVDNFSTTCTAQVIEKSPFPLILGMEFLQRFKCLIDLRRNQISLYTKKGRRAVIPIVQRGNLDHNGALYPTFHKPPFFRKKIQHQGIKFTSPSMSFPKSVNYKQLYQQEFIRNIKNYWQLGSTGENEGKCNNRKASSSQQILCLQHNHNSNTVQDDYELFWKSMCDEEIIEFKGKFYEKPIDIFSVPNSYALAHCIPANLDVSRGIATCFKEKFGGSQQLLKQNKGPGEAAVLENLGRILYYLIIKERSDQVPSYTDLFKSLCEIRKHMEKNNIKRLAMPRIGCGIDNLQWEIVSKMIKYVFSDHELEIIVCTWNPVKKNRTSDSTNAAALQTVGEFVTTPRNHKEATLQDYSYTAKTCVQTTPEVACREKLVEIQDKDLWNLLPSYIEETGLFGKVKLRAKRQYSIQPFQEKYIEVCIDQERIQAWNCSSSEFILNHKLFNQKRLSLLDGPYNSNQKIFIKVKLNSAYPAHIFKDSTIGLLRKSTDNGNDNLISLSMRAEKREAEYEDSEGQVTLEDHEMKHIADVSLRVKLSELLEEYADVFAKNTRYMGRTELIKHKIELEEGTSPIKCSPYRVSHKEREIIGEQIEEMLQHNIITPCHSPWAFPIVLVKKKDGKMRFCVDYRKLNEKTKKTNYPLPNIEDIMTYMGGSTMWSRLDLFSGYWQVQMDEDSKDLTAFVAQGQGAFRFEVMPFGLCGAPGTFQLLADSVFAGLTYTKILCYLDDVIIFSKDPEEHLEKLRLVFQRLREAGLTLKPNKCEYFKEEIDILGYTVNRHGIKPDASKVEAISNFKTPKKLKDVRSFLGASGFYRKFIENYSIHARPLYDLTKKDVKFHWDKEQENAFQFLKKKLTSAPVLQHFNPQKGTTLHVDASRIGVGGVLLQENMKGEEHPIAYISRTLNKNEKNYTISELEGLAVVWSLRTLRHLIYGRPIKIVSDHSALCWLNSIKNSGRLCRYAISLSEFDYTIHHKKGCLNRDADFLSRNPLEKDSRFLRRQEILEDIPTFTLDVADLDKPNGINTTNSTSLSLSPEDVRRLQETDEKLREIMAALENPEDATLALRKRTKQFKLINDTLYKIEHSYDGIKELLVIPKNLIGEILFSHHSCALSGHLGLTKTLHKIKSRYYWDTLQKDVAKYVKGCRDCQARKGVKRKPAGNLQPIQIGLPFYKMGIDLMGPFRRSKDGKTMIVCCVDYATRWVEAKALPNGKADSVAKFILENIITRHGAPQIILSDRGRVFQSELVQELLRIMGVVSTFTTAYNPSCNGLVERINNTYKNMLKNYVNTEQTDWSFYIPHITFAYNSSVHETTKFTPFELVYGRTPVLPTEASLMQPISNIEAQEIRERALLVRTMAVDNILKKQKIDKKYYDARHRPISFEVGDQVKVFVPIRKKGRSEKLLLRYFGPYYVEEKIGEVNYKIRKGKSKRAKTDIYHISKILPYYDEWTPMPENEDEDSDQNNEAISGEEEPEENEEESATNTLLIIDDDAIDSENEAIESFIQKENNSDVHNKGEARCVSPKTRVTVDQEMASESELTQFYTFVKMLKFLRSLGVTPALKRPDLQRGW